jgi:branched-chain amino acid transport system permease protein
MIRFPHYTPPLATVVVLGAMPLVFPGNYYLTVLTLCCLHAMHAVGLCLLVGHAGQVSLGHGGFYGLAAYTSAILSTRLALPVELSMLAGVLVTVGFATAVGHPALKLRGHSLAMATLGGGVILSIIFTEAVELTGGPSGLVGIPRISLFGHLIQSDPAVYAIVVLVLGAMMLLAHNLLRSRVGRALRTLHSSEAAAHAMGVNVAQAKLFVFVLSAAFSAISGVLYAHYLTFIAPSSFGFLFSVELIVMVVLGGMTSLPGSVSGAFLVTWLPELLRHFENTETIFFGLILLGCMRFFPQGLAGAASHVWCWVARVGVNLREKIHG